MFYLLLKACPLLQGFTVLSSSHLLSHYQPLLILSEKLIEDESKKPVTPHVSKLEFKKMNCLISSEVWKVKELG